MKDINLTAARHIIDATPPNRPKSTRRPASSRTLAETAQIVPTASEDVEQQQLIEWAAWKALKYPELQLLYHIPNEGKRSSKEGGKQKRMGLRAGIPDLCLPVARQGKHGLYIEMKVGKNRPRENQRQWLEQLAAQGYHTAVCYSCEEAARELMLYIANTEETGLYEPGKQQSKTPYNQMP